MALMTYLIKDRNGTYYFRRVIPPALRPFMAEPWTGKENFKLSLRTKKPAVAKVEASKALMDCTIALENAKRAMRGEPITKHPAPEFDAPALAEIEGDIIAELLLADEAEREEGDDRRRLQTATERMQWPDLVPVAFGRKGMAVDHSHVYGMHVEELLGEYQEALARRDPQIVDAELRTYLKKHRVPIDPTSDSYRQHGLAVLRGHVRGYELINGRQRGKIVDTPAPKLDKGPKLSEAFASWKDGGKAKGARKPAANTVSEAEHVFRRFREWHGDLRLGEIDKAKARDFRDALAKVPTRLSQELKKLSLKAILKRDLSKLPSPYASTINKSLTLLSAMISHAMKEGRMDHVAYVNPFQGIKLELDARAVEGRNIFEAADLKAIFENKIYVKGYRPRGGGGEAAFWLPLIALFTGARQGELAQLRLDDLRQDPETGIWFFDIGTEGGRSIKTASSRRKVPVHPHLEKVGLLRYRQSFSGNNAKLGADLWPDIKSDAQGRRAGPWSKWFNRYLRESAKVEGDGKVFHSFRHTFKRLARDARISEELHDALTGHSGGGVGRSYGGGFGLKALAEALSQIEAPEATKGLAWKPAAF